MTALDIFVLLLIGGGALFGLVRGFVMETLSLMAWVLAVLAIRLFHAPVAAVLSEYVGTPSGAAALALVLLFGTTFAVGKMIASALGARTRKSVLGPLDRVLGGGFGAIKGLIGVTLLFMAFTLVHDTIYGGGSARPAWLKSSRTFPLLDASSRALSAFLEERRNGRIAAADD